MLVTPTVSCMLSTVQSAAMRIETEPSEQKCSCAYVFSQFLQGLSLDIKEYRAFGLAHRTACYYLGDYHEKGFQDKCNENQCKMKINIIKHIIIPL